MNEVNNKLSILNALQDRILELGENMLHNQNVYPMDILANAILNRSASLIDGFVLLIKENNYICAGHLVRIHLDSLLRLSAAWMVEKPNEFALKILNGEQINKIKDKDGNLMTDKHLVKALSSDYPWIENVYKESSGFIHLSYKHFYMSTGLETKESNVLELSISKKDRFVPDISRIEAIEAMIEITNCICDYIKGLIIMLL